MSSPLGFARDMARELRRVPALRDLFERSDPTRRARRILQSGIIDTELYAILVSREEISAAEAAHHYVTWGHWAGLPINPLMDDSTLRRTVGGGDRPSAFEYLWTGSFDAQVSPFWDAPDYAREHPEALSHPAGPVGHLWDRAQKDPDTPVRIRRGDDTVTVSWRQWHASFLAALQPWAESDALRRGRRLNRHFHGVDSLGEWTRPGPRPVVSIVLATWNRAGELRSAVDSVLAQTWNDWELLIIDDGSWDDTALIGGLLQGRDGRIRFLPQPHRGVSATRNAGLAAAQGEFVTFLDSDNVWEPRFLEDMMIAMTEGGDAAAFATLKMDNRTHRLFREAEASLKSLEHGNVIDLNILVVRSDAMREVGGFDEALARAVDYDLILRLAQRYPIRHVPILGAVYGNHADRSDRISTSQPLGWNTYVRVKNLIDWDELDTRQLAPGTDVVMVVPRYDPIVDERIAIARELAESTEIDVHLAFIAPEPSSWARGQLTAAEAPRLHTHLFGGPEPLSYLVTMMLPALGRQTVVVLEPSARFDADAIHALAERVSTRPRAVVAPLLLHRDGTIVTIGAAFPKAAAAPVDVLSRHPVEDAEALGIDVIVPALSGRTFAMSTKDLIAVRGLDPLLYNEYELPSLSITLQKRFGGYAVMTATDIRMHRIELQEDFSRIDPDGSLTRVRDVTQNTAATDLGALLAPLDFRVSHFQAVRANAQRATLIEPPAEGDAESRGDVAHVRLPEREHLYPVVTRDRRMVDIDGRAVPRLRWAIRIASPAGPNGRIWGDTHFARSLAAGLRGIGQEVVIDHHEVTTRPAAYLDDVTLVLRGLDEVAPVTGGVSMLWVISHPDLVTRKEAAQFDRVFAASTKWSRESSTRWGLEIRPLLQCTDPALFHPSGTERGADAVFVGKSRGVPRPSVVTPVAAGIPVRVFGTEWEGILPADAVEAPYVPNDELARLYESAGVVLNDHWNDMRREGFISNRLFDVVASGGRALSDEVEGLDEIFGGTVRVFRDSSELVDMLRGDLDQLFPDDARRVRASEEIREQHSFEARARVLLDAALESLGLTS